MRHRPCKARRSFIRARLIAEVIGELTASAECESACRTRCSRQCRSVCPSGCRSAWRRQAAPRRPPMCGVGGRRKLQRVGEANSRNRLACERGTGCACERGREVAENGPWDRSALAGRTCRAKRGRFPDGIFAHVTRSARGLSMRLDPAEPRTRAHEKTRLQTRQGRPRTGRGTVGTEGGVPDSSCETPQPFPPRLRRRRRHRRGRRRCCRCDCRCRCRCCHFCWLPAVGRLEPLRPQRDAEDFVERSQRLARPAHERRSSSRQANSLVAAERAAHAAYSLWIAPRSSCGHACLCVLPRVP